MVEHKPTRKPRGQSNPPFKFTERSINALKPGPKRQTFHDTEVKELGLLLQPSGHRSYFMFFRVQRGQPGVWHKLGDADRMPVDKARSAARLKLGQVADWKLKRYEGESPLSQPRPEITVGELIDDYIQRHLKPEAKNPEASAKNVEWARDKYLSEFKNRPLNRLLRKDLIDFHKKLGETSGQRMANRCVQLVRTVYNFARRMEIYLGPNPAVGIELFSEAERDRWMNGAELAKLFTAMKKKPHRDLDDFIKLSLWTGARRSNVLSMRWSDLALDDNRWTITESKTKPYVIALAPEAVKLLRERSRHKIKDCDWVFPGVGKSGHLMDLKKPWHALLKRAGLDNLRVHDLRRTHGSFQANLGTPLNVIGKSLGHGDGSNATHIYARLQLDPVRDSVERATKAMVKASRKAVKA